MLKGIDVSVYQGNIDWEKVKSQIDFAIIRCGLGDDIKSQDDKQFERNYSECTRLGIPFAIYFFSYAVNKAKVTTEIAHIKRLLSGKKINAPVYIDVENTNGLNWRSISDATMLDIMKEFNTQLNALGYKMGIYSSRSAFWNEKMKDSWYDGISKWVAEYGDKVNDFNRAYDIWQYTSKGRVDGIAGNVDMNNMYNNIFTEDKPQPTPTPTPKPQPTPKPTPQPTKIDVTYQVWDDVRNAWLPNVKNTEDYAGIFGHDVCALYASLSKGNVTYAVHYKGGKWLPAVVNRSDYAGLYNKPIDGLMMKTDTGKTIRYRVHLRQRNAWLPWVTGYNAKDSNNGYAGILGQEIDGVQIEIK